MTQLGVALVQPDVELTIGPADDIGPDGHRTDLAGCSFGPAGLALAQPDVALAQPDVKLTIGPVRH